MSWGRLSGSDGDASPAPAPAAGARGRSGRERLPHANARVTRRAAEAIGTGAAVRRALPG